MGIENESESLRNSHPVQLLPIQAPIACCFAAEERFHVVEGMIVIFPVPSSTDSRARTCKIRCLFLSAQSSCRRVNKSRSGGDEENEKNGQIRFCTTGFILLLLRLCFVTLPLLLLPSDRPKSSSSSALPAGIWDLF